MFSLFEYSTDCQESIAPNRFSKFDRERAFRAFFDFRPMGLYMDKHRNNFEKRFGAIDCCGPREYEYSLYIIQK